MIRRAWLLGLLALAAALAASPLWAPPALRRVAWFRVRRVEVAGARLLPPHEVLSAARIARGQSVWDDPAAWEAALLDHPAIAGVRVTRKLPHTVRIRVEEKQPVAYVLAETLRPATAAGEVLPVDPARAALDLPIVRTGAAEGGARSREVAALLAETGRLARLDPGLVAMVSEVRAGEGGCLVLTLSEPALEVVMPAEAPASRLAELRAVLAELRRWARADGSGRAGGRVDLRFEDQIVVRHPPSV